MPERPDLEYVVPILHEQLRGARIDALRLPKPVVLRMLVDRAPGEALAGHTIEAVTRRAHFVVFDLSPSLRIVVSPMLAGRFAIEAATVKQPADTAFVLGFADGRELRYRDEVQMGKVYIAAVDAVGQIPGFAKIGVDVLSKAFTKTLFRKLARTRRDQAKVFLMDKAALDALGNAYADEVLFEARLHPKAMVRSLPDERIDALHDALVKVLGEAAKTIRDRAPPLDEKLRDFLKVRGRKGESCSRCGTKLRTAGVHGHDAYFCPQCQPDDRGTGLIDWRKVPKKPG